MRSSARPSTRRSSSGPERTRSRSNPSKLGAVAYAKNAVAHARSAKPGTKIPLGVNVDGGAVRRLVASLGKRFDREPVDSKLLLRNLEPYVTKGEPGKRLDRTGALARDRARAAREPPHRHHAARTRMSTRRSLAPTFGPVIVIRRGSNKLYLYKGMKPWRTFTVATGQAIYPTPLGKFEIVVKWKDPWWYPPNSPWAQGAKPIPPGPGNPLGTRWMGLSSPGVGIHGTPDPGSLGYSASHGCIRMYIPNAEWLFDHVDIAHAGLHRPGIVPAARLKHVLQGATVVVVLGLLALLVWKVTHEDKGVEDRAAAGRRAAPRSTSRGSTRPGSWRSPRCAARSSSSTSGRRGARRARRRRRASRPRGSSTGSRASSSSASTRRTSPATRSASCSKHRLTYPNVHDGPGHVLPTLRRHRLPGDVLRRPPRPPRRRARRGRDQRRRKLTGRHPARARRRESAAASPRSRWLSRRPRSRASATRRSASSRAR